MKAEHRNEVLCLYVGYFVTLAVGLIPALSWYAIGALALQLFYAIIRHVSTTEPIFRSHTFNYMLAVGVSFAVGLLIIIQAQAVGGEVLNALTSLVFGSRTGAASSLGYIFFMMALEAIFAIFWPIVLIGRGLYLINAGRPVSFGSRPTSAATAAPASAQGATRPDVTRSVARKWLASAVTSDGRVMQFELDGDRRVLVIGRDKENADIVMSEDTVGRRQARIEMNDGSPWISDLGSVNQTKVNGREIGFNPVQLRAGDRVQLGAVTLTISAA